ncbi:uncharacterized protein LOC121868306 [Homarus americanus]|uniref:Uncharacterized protein n=1 Tax=Homarus americanus TaxID=6706 RepID=A0A8J5K4K5_HOMAM|nr:uncharacterized protein LOC121868306 [Homarus americanus]XP_042224707.1 uncharacterized protein LOC121868306 [Homarus americanus]XP_042224708.1 uncharacterized protein LOC121868306 [Homarus americanus]KAG7167448.1 hypothetical protein Hamer_G012908 [Homarus americanus]
MAPSTRDSTWRSPSSPREVASSVVASVQYVTSSVRLLLVGCFQCGSLKPGCWRRQEEQDGAWFDCEKLQVEHPFCYVNPVALSEGAPNTATQQPPLLQQPKPHTQPQPKHLPRLKTSQQPKPTLNGVSHTILQHGSPTNNTTDMSHKTHGKPLVNGVMGTEGGAVIYKNGQVRSHLVGSFAAKLEADLKKLECDRQRAEGKALTSPEETVVLEDVDSLPKYLCTESQNDEDFFTDETTDYYGNFVDEKRLEDEVWKPSELEDVFECYNMAAFYSYGATMPVNEKFTCKNRGEKYEEVFPVTFHNNNNTIKVYRPASESESPLSLTSKDQVIKENSLDSCGIERKREILEPQLKELIQSCVFVNNVDEVSVPCPEGTCTNAVCDDSIYYGGRSFNKLLMFNLVRSIMSECNEHYSHAMSLCVNYPVHLVQSRVLGVLQMKEDNSQLTPSGLQVFRNSSLLNADDNESYQHQQLTERLVQNVVVAEVRADDKLWHKFGQEELEIKEALSTELFDNLISETTSLYSSLLRKKLMQ